MIYQGQARYPVREACLHTLALPTGWIDGKGGEDALQALWRWHTQGEPHRWRKIGYHRLVMPDGTVLHDNGQRLRSLWEVGAGVKGHNRGVAHIAMANVRAHDHGRITTFADYFTAAQREAVIDYLRELSDLTELRKVSGHNDYAPKECPGFKVRTEDWLLP